MRQAGLAAKCHVDDDGRDAAISYSLLGWTLALHRFPEHELDSHEKEAVELGYLQGKILCHERRMSAQF